MTPVFGVVVLTMGRADFGRDLVATAEKLGEASPASHYRIGHLAAGSSVDLLFTFGEDAARIARGAVEGGMDPEAVMHTGDRERLRGMVGAALRDGDLVLVKASRGAELDLVVDDLVRMFGEDGVRA